MGNWMSGPVETPQQRRARLQRQHGILIPPSFVNGTLLPIASQAALQARQAVTPSILDYLWETNPGTRLLHEYFQPGIAMRIPTSPSSSSGTVGGDSGEILVGLQPILQPQIGGNGTSPSSSTTTSTITPAAAAAAETTITSSNSLAPSSLNPLIPPPSNSNNKLQHTSSIIATHHYDPFQLRVHVPTNHAPSILISSRGSNFSFSTRLPLMTGSIKIHHQCLLPFG